MEKRSRTDVTGAEVQHNRATRCAKTRETGPEACPPKPLFLLVSVSSVNMCFQEKPAEKRLGGGVG
mgnify:CR=1 FL=1|jgi:hypothetical protein